MKGLRETHLALSARQRLIVTG
ncbi:hypothetical protein SAM23877_7413 [Streptomyces ambofaciens ATCC 23877]|uniref:Uncharacterized protein n=1 Tax=Streptomyces ambofaciens (strain ATCC 23877 / 3486 / DSM 40053 / JCM 4204 / NBRC 12836 / NRRL B-2516) TaxID=278992 RepID=A0A0K2B593_STRA7|nr:hypothetical protein SAM23877_7413 [Streptomyces ambofaciens ATCC 23877]